MNEEQIIEMLSDIIKEVDYDIWKDIFLDEDEPQLDEFLGIVNQHLIKIFVPEEHHPDCNCRECK